MKMSTRLLIAQLALAAAGTFAVAASASAQEVIVAPNAPPPVRYEAVPAPRTGYVWDRGHWRWQGGQYAWVPGHWERVHVGYHWVTGHWARRGPNWVWVQGRWAR
ncbi:YXWGXW repeat-containing protein [Trinickia acidisoli]|uniref:YXWGXW repeat-containing protein n=1 Tax=Trinickia acidisoli TaxID=2767482 RepID=UPI001A90126F|nr:YXWGXW repeat-containing protein [Trinickia acidisoli]